MLPLERTCFSSLPEATSVGCGSYVYIRLVPLRPSSSTTAGILTRKKPLSPAYSLVKARLVDATVAAIVDMRAPSAVAFASGRPATCARLSDATSFQPCKNPWRFAVAEQLLSYFLLLAAVGARSHHSTYVYIFCYFFFFSS